MLFLYGRIDVLQLARETHNVLTCVAVAGYHSDTEMNGEPSMMGKLMRCCSRSSNNRECCLVGKANAPPVDNMSSISIPHPKANDREDNIQEGSPSSKSDRE